jgi:hypothetical protein
LRRGRFPIAVLLTTLIAVVKRLQICFFGLPTKI